MAKEKTYVGIGWQGQYGINMSISADKIKDLPKDKYGNILLSIHQRKEPDTKSRATHYIVVNDYAYDKEKQNG